MDDSGSEAEAEIEIPVAEPMTREQALAMEGTGWDGDLDEMREGGARDSR